MSHNLLVQGVCINNNNNNNVTAATTDVMPTTDGKVCLVMLHGSCSVDDVQQNKFPHFLFFPDQKPLKHTHTMS